MNASIRLDRVTARPDNVKPTLLTVKVVLDREQLALLLAVQVVLLSVVMSVGKDIVKVVNEALKLELSVKGVVIVSVTFEA